MKCPHCKFVSFEYLNSCRKCSKDLVAHKSQHGIEFLEPISLGILTFVDTGSVQADSDAGDGMSFDTGDVMIDSGDALEDEAPSDSSGDTAGEDDFQFALGDEAEGGATVEAVAEESAEADVVEISDTDEGVEVAKASEESVEVEIDEAAVEVAADDTDMEETGFSLGLGDDLGDSDDGLDFGSDDSSDDTGSEEIALDDTSPDEELSVSLDDDTGAESGSDDEISLTIDEPAGDADDLSVEPAQEEKASEGGDNDFEDIELSLDDKDMFGDEDSGSDDDLDLGDLDLDLPDK